MTANDCVNKRPVSETEYEEALQTGTTNIALIFRILSDCDKGHYRCDICHERVRILMEKCQINMDFSYETFEGPGHLVKYNAIEYFFSRVFCSNKTGIFEQILRKGCPPTNRLVRLIKTEIAQYNDDNQPTFCAACAEEREESSVHAIDFHENLLSLCYKYGAIVKKRNQDLKAFIGTLLADPKLCDSIYQFSMTEELDPPKLKSGHCVIL